MLIDTARGSDYQDCKMGAGNHITRIAMPSDAAKAVILFKASQKAPRPPSECPDVNPVNINIVQ